MEAKRYFERLPERAIGRIVCTKMPLVIEHMRRDALFENWEFSEWGAADGDSSFIGVPIKDRGDVVGTLTIDREHAEVPYFSSMRTCAFSAWSPTSWARPCVCSA